MGRHTLIEPGTVAAEADYSPRLNGGDAHAHYYLKRELADSSISHLTPWCLNGKPAPDRHPRAMVDNQAAVPGTAACSGCLAELRLVRTGRIS